MARPSLSLVSTARIAQVFGALVACSAARGQTYQIVELSLPPAAASGTARAINSTGHAAGEYQDGAGNLHPVTWINGVTMELPLPPGYPGAGATGISDTGLVCGSAWTQGSFGFSAAVVWQNAAPAFIPTLGGQYSAADGISASGTVVGWTSTYGDFKGPRAFRYTNTTLTSAGVIHGGGGSWTNGCAINATGQIVGMGMTTSRFHHAFLDDPAEGMMDLGTLGGVASQALAISNAGHVAGWSQTGIRNAAVDDGMVEHAFLWFRGKLSDLGVLPGLVESRAMGVNTGGTVVGRCTGAAPGSTPRAFVWKAGVMTDLNAAVPAGSGWTLQHAYAINDSGRIVGSGLLAGQTRAFVLIPIP